MTLQEKFDYIQNSKELQAEYKYFNNVINGLLKELDFYYPEVYLLPITPTGEELFEWLMWNGSEYISFRYGHYSQMVKHGEKLFNLIIINND